MRHGSCVAWLAPWYSRSVHAPVAILGAGLTGMSAAHHLGAVGVGYRLFEKQMRAGGLAVTCEEQGYRFDRTGHLLHVRDDAIRDLALRWMGPEHRWIERNSAVWSHGVYTRYPFQANLYGLPPAVAQECLTTYLRAWRRADAGPYRSFEHFCQAKFGEGISRHFMVPYNTRMWGVPPSEITASWCQRFVPIPTPRDVVAGAAGLPTRQLGYNARFVYPKLGIGQLSDGLAREVACETSRAPLGIDGRELVFEDERVPFDALISTVPLPTLVALLSDVPRPVADAAAKLRCSHLNYLDVALERPCGKPFQWVYVPEPKYPFYRVGCYAHFSSAMAPAGKSNLYVELAQRGAIDVTSIAPGVIAGLIEMGLIDTPADVAFIRARRIEHAYVIFDHDYFAATQTIHAFLAERRIVSSGRYGHWNYSSMADALAFGRDAANDTCDILGTGGAL